MYLRGSTKQVAEQLLDWADRNAIGDVTIQIMFAENRPEMRDSSKALHWRMSPEGHRLRNANTRKEHPRKIDIQKSKEKIRY